MTIKAMRNFVLLLSLTALQGIAQDVIDTDCHRPMFVQGKSWNYTLERVYMDENHQIEEYPRTYTVDGDTLIDGDTYWKIYCEDGFTGKRTFNSAWREEGHKVLSTAWQAEMYAPDRHYIFLEQMPLMYDFSDAGLWQSIFRIWTGLDESFIVKVDNQFSIDSILVKGRLYRRFIDTKYHDLKWVEGIGSIAGLFAPSASSTALDGTEYEVFNSCSENGEIIFSISDFLAPPYHPSGGVQGTFPVTSDVRNPSTLFDLQGRRLSNSQLSNSQMRKGVYIQNGRKVIR